MELQMEVEPTKNPPPPPPPPHPPPRNGTAKRAAYGLGSRVMAGDDAVYVRACELTPLEDWTIAPHAVKWLYTMEGTGANKF